MVYEPTDGYAVCSCGYIIKKEGDCWYHVILTADEICRKPMPKRIEDDRIKGDLL